MQRKQITFIGNRRKSITILALAGGLGALGIGALLLVHPALGIFLMAASAAPVVVSLPNAVSPRSRHLHLDPSGFEVRARSDRYRIEWADVTQFRWGLRHGTAVIEIEYAQHIGLDASGDEPRTARIFDRYDAPLPYVMGKLVEWRLHYGPRRGPTLCSLCRD